MHYPKVTGLIEYICTAFNMHRRTYYEVNGQIYPYKGMSTNIGHTIRDRQYIPLIACLRKISNSMYYVYSNISMV